MKRRSPKEIAAEVEIIAKAEKILNRTLAYQAAIAVHELKDVLGIDVEELRLAVAPLSMESPGVYRISCSIASLATPDPVVLDLVVEPDKAVTPNGKKAAD